MGNLVATLTLATTDVLTSDIRMSVTANVTADSGQMSRAKIAATGVTGAFTIYKENDKQESAYVYIKNMSQEREQFIYVFNDTANDDSTVLKLGGNEFAFMPMERGQTLKAYGTVTNQTVEYGVFGVDDPAIMLS
jgi:hypothetical protein